MHKGRIYPYSPQYYTTEGWFWPGFVPWKMELELIFVSLPPSPQFSPGFMGTSDAGVVSADRQSITYHWSLPSGGLASDFFVECYSNYYGAVKLCVIHCYSELDGVNTGEVWNYQPAGQRAFGTWLPELYRLIDDPEAPPVEMGFVMGYSDYAQGGSPWS